MGLKVINHLDKLSGKDPDAFIKKLELFKKNKNTSYQFGQKITEDPKIFFAHDDATLKDEINSITGFFDFANNATAAKKLGEDGMPDLNKSIRDILYPTAGRSGAGAEAVAGGRDEDEDGAGRGGRAGDAAAKVKKIQRLLDSNRHQTDEDAFFKYLYLGALEDQDGVDDEQKIRGIRMINALHNLKNKDGFQVAFSNFSQSLESIQNISERKDFVISFGKKIAKHSTEDCFNTDDKITTFLLPAPEFKEFCQQENISQSLDLAKPIIKKIEDVVKAALRAAAPAAAPDTAAAAAAVADGAGGPAAGGGVGGGAAAAAAAAAQAAAAAAGGGAGGATAGGGAGGPAAAAVGDGAPAAAAAADGAGGPAAGGGVGGGAAAAAAAAAQAAAAAAGGGAGGATAGGGAGGPAAAAAGGGVGVGDGGAAAGGAILAGGGVADAAHQLSGPPITAPNRPGPAPAPAPGPAGGGAGVGGGGGR
jgi:hypothetical protein